ncbi:MAG TPA: hypothetical protein VK658_01790 [Chryseolinea sp.]|nr:hypothetical protein [Chryseolinea sp.]
MDIREIIERQREAYLKQLTKFYSERTTGAKEILLELNGDEKERIFKLYRLDYYEQVDGQGKPTELGADTYLNHEPTNYKFGQLSIELNPFFWHGCDFAFKQELTDVDWLKNWTRKWIDEEDKKPTDTNGLSGVIHNVTRLTSTTNNETKFSVDFGSADVDSVVGLIETIEKQGIRELKIGFEMIG